MKTTTYSMAPADLTKMNQPLVVGILFILVLYVTMVYGPIAAMLVEMFRPASATPRCRCPTTSATAGSAASCRP